MVPIWIYLLISFLIGGLTCFFGKKLYFPMLMINVFFAVVTLSLSIFDLTLFVGVTTVIIATWSAMIAYYFYKVGVFLIGGILGGSLSIFVISLLPSFMLNYAWIIVAVFVVIFGVWAVKWCDFFIIISTSFNGAFTISTLLYFLVLNFNHLHDFVYADGILSTITNLNSYISNEFIMQHSFILFVITIIICLSAIVFQVFNYIKEQCK